MIRDRARARGRNEAARPAKRRNVEELLHLADHLPRGERALVQAVLKEGQAVRFLAEVGGGSSSTLSQRLQAVLRRLRSREFQLVAVRGAHLDPTDRRTAQMLFLDGRSCREVAERTGQPLCRVRRLRDAIRHMVVMLDQHADS